KRHAGLPKGAGQCHGAKVEQVHEVRVVTKVGVELNGVGLNLWDGVGGAGGRHQQQVHLRPCPCCLRLEHLQTVQTFKGVHCGEPCSAADDLASDGQEGVGVAGIKVLERCQAFRHPRAVVEQLGRLPKRREVDLDAFASHAFQQRD